MEHGKANFNIEYLCDTLYTPYLRQSYKSKTENLKRLRGARFPAKYL